MFRRGRAFRVSCDGGGRLSKPFKSKGNPVFSKRKYGRDFGKERERKWRRSSEAFRESRGDFREIRGGRGYSSPYNRRNTGDFF